MKKDKYEARVRDELARVENEHWKQEVNPQFLSKIESNLMSVNNLSGLF